MRTWRSTAPSSPGRRCSSSSGPSAATSRRTRSVGETEAEQGECAKAFDEEFFTAATIQIDNGPVVDFLAPRFELLSPQRSVVLPEDNFLGVDPGPATFVAHGWGAIARLKPGQHVVTVEVTDVSGFTTTAVATFNVVPGTR